MQTTKSVSILSVLGLVLFSASAFAQDSDQPTPPKRHRHRQAAPAAQPAAETKPADSDDRSGAVAGEPDSDGCGLGWQVSDKKTILGSITRGSTNSIIPPSFGMTSGTLGCRKTPFSKRDQAGVTYAISNYDALRIEMAEGRGETLDAFARTLGCDDSVAFGRMTQANYSSLVQSKSGAPISAVQMFRQVKTLGCGA